DHTHTREAPSRSASSAAVRTTRPLCPGTTPTTTARAPSTGLPCQGWGAERVMTSCLRSSRYRRPEQSGPPCGCAGMTTIGFIGAGQIGGTLAHLAVEHGYDV